jgi:ribosome biogenesis protein NSA2
MAKKLRGLKGKIFHNERYKEKAEMHKKIKAHQEKDVKCKSNKKEDQPLPTYLMDRE